MRNIKTSSNDRNVLSTSESITGGGNMPQDLLTQVEAADTIDEMSEAFGSEEELLTFVKKAVRFKEQQRLSHKKNYLRTQLILQKAKLAGIVPDDEE